MRSAAGFLGRTYIFNEMRARARRPPVAADEKSSAARAEVHAIRRSGTMSPAHEFIHRRDVARSEDAISARRVAAAARRANADRRFVCIMPMAARKRESPSTRALCCGASICRRFLCGRDIALIQSGIFPAVTNISDRRFSNTQRLMGCLGYEIFELMYTYCLYDQLLKLGLLILIRMDVSKYSKLANGLMLNFDKCKSMSVYRNMKSADFQYTLFGVNLNEASTLR